ncbi:hypothetical protein [Streptomyces sp. NPDC001546]|uniref:hypothetical protein n=1 Tax=Streptomyces sp. NPDC001546 TaxID=3364585 RepID=UPI0036AF59D9
MQFLAQILLDGLGRPVREADIQADHVMAIFMCQNDPGMCDEWIPTASGNRALLYPSDALQPMAAPEPNEDEDVLRLGVVNAVALVSSPCADYVSAREDWAIAAATAWGTSWGSSADSLTGFKATRHPHARPAPSP